MAPDKEYRINVARSLFFFFTFYFKQIDPSIVNWHCAKFARNLKNERFNSLIFAYQSFPRTLFQHPVYAKERFFFFLKIRIQKEDNNEVENVQNKIKYLLQ